MTPEAIATRARWAALWISVLLVAVAVAPPAAAASRSLGRYRHVVVVVADRTSLAEWASPGLPTLRRLLATSAVGLMNSNTASGPAAGASALTLGASAQLRGPEALAFLPADARLGGTTAAAVFATATGIPPPRGALLLPSLPAILAANQGLPYDVHVGALADLLAAHGLRAAAVGEADRPPWPGSPAVLDSSFAALAMDSRGIVPVGDVSPTLDRSDARFPFGVAVDDRALLSATLAALRRAPFTVVVDGDTERADAFQADVLPTQRAAVTRAALQNLDRFLALLLPRLPRDTLLIVLSPLPSAAMVRADATLTPVLLHGAGIPPGYLTSPSTHRQGIVTDVDVAPTVLAAFGIATPPTLFGQPMAVLPHPAPARWLVPLASRLAFQSAARVPLLETTVYFIVLTFLAAALYLLFARRRWPGAERWLRAALLAVLWLGFAVLVLPAFGARTLAASFAAEAAAVAVPAALTLLLARHPLDRILAPTLLTAAVLLADLLTGQHLIQNSPLGYDPQIGARYYGIGNEFMGVLIGTSALGATALLDRWGRRLLPLTVALYAFVVVVMVTPDLGTKAGGAITATVALGVILYRLSGRAIRWREALTLALVALGLLVLIVAADLVLHGAAERTDLGRTGLLLLHGGPAQALLIIVRKIGTNVSLVVRSYWSLLFAVAVVITAVLASRALGTFRDLKARHPHLAHGFTGAVVGAAVAFVFNDTGVVAACTTVMYPVATALLIDLARGPVRAGAAAPRPRIASHG